MTEHAMRATRPGAASRGWRDARERWAPLAAAGSVLAAVGASSCCLIPLALVGAGVSGAWIGGLTALSSYQPAFVAATLAFLGAGFFAAYHRPKAADCADGGVCADPKRRRATRLALWFAAVLVAAAVAFNYTAPILLG